MPWGCIGQSKLGSSGPGTGSCGLPGTFNQQTSITPATGSTQSADPTVRGTK